MDLFSAVQSAAYNDEPTAVDPNWSIYEGDALEKLSLVEAGSCKLIITSPPYNIGKEYERDQRLSLREYLRWLDKIIAALCEKVASDGHSRLTRLANELSRDWPISVHLKISLNEASTIRACFELLRSCPTD